MSLKKAIKKTVEYAWKFGSEINIKEIEQRLISNKVYDAKEIKKATNEFVIINKKNKWKDEKIKKTEKLAKTLEKTFKELLFLGITGSVAAGHPKKNDDIDLILITKKDGLWWLRFKLRLFILWKRIPHRRRGKKEEKDEFCFNLWLDESNLLIPKNRQKIQSAMDLIMIIPIINKNEVYEKLLVQNFWAKKYLATGFYKKTKDIRIKKNDLEVKQNWTIKLTNRLFFCLQYWYMRKKITTEEVNLHQAFFYK